VLALNILDGLAALEVFGDVASMSLTAARNRSVRLDNVSSRGRHAHSQILDLINGLIDTVGRTNDKQLIGILTTGWLNDGAASLSQEVVD
jgi:hypothetical protein